MFKEVRFKSSSSRSSNSISSRTFNYLNSISPRSLNFLNSRRSLRSRRTVECLKIRVKILEFVTSPKISIFSKCLTQKTTIIHHLVSFFGIFLEIFFGSSLNVQEGQVREFPKFKKIFKIKLNSQTSKDSRKISWHTLGNWL
jgi:hypothetical protein